MIEGTLAYFFVALGRYKEKRNRGHKKIRLGTRMILAPTEGVTASILLKEKPTIARAKRIPIMK